jgi:hypothetical protein
MNDRTTDKLSNGPGAAAILAAAIGSFTLSVFALAGDASKTVATAMNVWHPTGPLSGVTDAAILTWLVSWLIISRMWKQRDVNLTGVNVLSFALFSAAILITFPPIMDLLQGK